VIITRKAGKAALLGLSFQQGDERLRFILIVSSIRLYCKKNPVELVKALILYYGVIHV
jgi:hypothetical protein